jgi:asparagine synthase (glutamine-hydrolysing)
MCGIAGVVAFNEKGKKYFSGIEHAIQCLGKRGPDANGTFTHNHVLLAHTRLSIIDTSSAAAQPMTNASGRYTIIFNGEFFNFKEHREFVLKSATGTLKSGSDTEVLLHLYMIEKEKCLDRLNGFFSLAIYDKEEETLFLARDRFGVKPFLIYKDDDKLLFASELKALVALGIPKELDEVSLFTYLQLNYIPGPQSIFRNVSRLEPGHFLKIQIRNEKPEIRNQQYYQIPLPTTSYVSATSSLSYEAQQKKLAELLDASVQRRLISDVPLGAFLSGGIDSSVVVALAARHTSQLKTFSIGFRDEPLFDETEYANLVAKKFNTDHTVFSLTTDDLLANLFEVLDYIDEPFADSSALPVYILSKHTRKKVTVALSGDGADELFGGYNKHAAELRVRNKDVMANTIMLLQPFWKALPQSRNSKTGNRFRQFNRFATGMKLPAKERYWSWAGFESEQEVQKMLVNNFTKTHAFEEYKNRKANLLKFIHEDGDLNDVLYTDMRLVLPYDMLVKVDLMSMANSLEVRTPFLDYEVVDFAFSLPLSSKIDGSGRKKIVRDAFRSMLPEELYTRNKQGFEVPLLKWFNRELKSLITDDLLSEKLIREQNIFHYEAIGQLKKKLFSNNPGESVDRAWALMVFQYWWKRTM